MQKIKKLAAILSTVALIAMPLNVFADDPVYQRGDTIRFQDASLILSKEQIERFDELRLTDAIFVEKGNYTEITPVFKDWVDENGVEHEEMSLAVTDNCGYGQLGSTLFYDFMTSDEGHELLAAHPGWTIIHENGRFETLVLPGKEPEDDFYLDLDSYYYDVIADGQDKVIQDYMIPGWEALFQLKEEYEFYASLTEPVQGGASVHRYNRDGSYFNGLKKAPVSGFCELYKDGKSVGAYTGYTKSKSGRRYYLNGRLIKNSWLKVNGERKYYAGPDGYFLTGRAEIGGSKLYRFDEKGEFTGEIK